MKKSNKINYKCFIIGIIVGVLGCFFIDIFCNLTETKEAFIQGWNDGYRSIVQ